MGAANQAQMLMLLNQVKNLESQLQMSQSQGVAPNPMNMNLINMLSQIQSKPIKSEKSKVGKGTNRSLPSVNPGVANLLAALSGKATGQEERGRCIWVTGLPDSYQDADKLSNLFGNFGNVRKVVFTEKKPDGVLIELDDPRGCVKAVANMRGQKLDGQEIKISFTKIDQAGMKNDSRFRKICCARLRKLSNSVIVSNLPEGKTDQLKKFIIESGYTVKSMEGSKRPVDDSKSKSDYTMAVVELASVDEAIDAVANLHNSWPKRFGAMKKDRFEHERGLVFSLAGVKETKEKSKA